MSLRIEGKLHLIIEVSHVYMYVLTATLFDSSAARLQNYLTEWYGRAFSYGNITNYAPQQSFHCLAVLEFQLYKVCEPSALLTILHFFSCTLFQVLFVS